LDFNIKFYKNHKSNENIDILYNSIWIELEKEVNNIYQKNKLKDYIGCWKNFMDFETEREKNSKLDDITQIIELNQIG